MRILPEKSMQVRKLAFCYWLAFVQACVIQQAKSLTR